MSYIIRHVRATLALSVAVLLGGACDLTINNNTTGGTSQGGAGGSGGAGGNNPCDTLSPGDVCGGNAADPIHGECHEGSCLWIDWTCYHNPEGTPCDGGVCAHSTVEPVCCSWCVAPDGTCSHVADLAGAKCPPCTTGEPAGTVCQGKGQDLVHGECDGAGSCVEIDSDCSDQGPGTPCGHGGVCALDANGAPRCCDDTPYDHRCVRDGVCWNSGGEVCGHDGLACEVCVGGGAMCSEGVCM